MDKDQVLKLLGDVASGNLSPEAAYSSLKVTPFSDIGFAKVDLHRELRQGTPEVIFGEGKTPQQIIGILNEMQANGQKRVLITRLDEEKANIINTSIAINYDPVPRIGTLGTPPPNPKGKIIVATGGTSDIPVAEEAAQTAEFLGNEVVRMYDVGVAGLHRLLAQLDTLVSARTVIAVAGMEGALASVIGGLVSCPVIAVPTSIGYGANLGGLSALLSMLNSCSSGVSVVNIDNGFGAGFLASRINQMEGLK